MTTGIYCILNTVTGKFYVGQAIDIDRRWKHHQHRLRAGKHDSRKLQNSFNKHRESAFEYAVICECQPDDLVALEQLHMDRLCACSRGYNMSPVAGGSNRGIRRSNETKARMSASAKAAKSTPEARRKMSAVFKVVFSTPEQKAKRASQAKASWSNPETRKRMVDGILASKSTPEARTRHVAAQRATFATPESKAKRSRSAVASHSRPEVRQRHTAAAVVSWSNPVAKAARIAKCRATRARRKRMIQRTMFDVTDDE